jgi:hypothetical protein
MGIRCYCCLGAQESVKGCWSEESFYTRSSIGSRVTVVMSEYKVDASGRSSGFSRDLWEAAGWRDAQKAAGRWPPQRWRHPTPVDSSPQRRHWLLFRKAASGGTKQDQEATAEWAEQQERELRTAPIRCT